MTYIDTLFEIRQKVIQSILPDATVVVSGQLSGVPQRSFDPGQIDYVVDGLSYRIENITSVLVNMAVDKLIPLLRAKLEEEIKEDLKAKVQRLI